MSEFIKNLKAILVFLVAFVLVSPFGFICLIVGLCVALWEYFHRHKGEAAIGLTMASVWVLIPVLLVVGLELDDNDTGDREIARYY